MREEILDCRGMSCPYPVVETKKRLVDIPAGILTVLVDNETAGNNLLKLSDNLGVKASVHKGDGFFSVTMHKVAEVVPLADTGGEVLLFSGATLGRGSEELGELLLRSFLYALAENEKVPREIYLVNAAVKLACQGSPVLDSLEKLVLRGLNLYSCGLCLDYFELKDKLALGEITNMYVIVEKVMAGRILIL